MILEYKELSDIDLKLHLLSGSPIRVDNLIIEPYTLWEIKNYGYSKFMEDLQWGLITKDDFVNAVKDENKRKILESMQDNLKTFDFYIKIFADVYFEKLINFLSLVFKTDDLGIVDKYKIVINSKHDKKDLKIVTRENFDDIVEVVKLQNYLEDVNEKGEHQFNPADEETQKLIEQMQKMRKKVEEIKRKQNQEDGKPITIYDVISAITAKNNSINKINVWDLTLYQLYDEYKRLQAIDNYDFSIRAIMAGAENVELKHWSSKL